MITIMKATRSAIEEMAKNEDYYFPWVILSSNRAKLGEWGVFAET